MRDKVISTIKKYNMLGEGDNVFVGLSGGADSIALTHALYCIKDTLKFNLYAIHINHNLRGEEAVRDQLFAEGFCKSLNIPLTVECHNVAELARTLGKSCEQAGRDVRYEAFERISGAYAQPKIATAHTLSDLTETMLFNMARGTGINGLAGIPAKRGNIIRPLIECTREEIEAYCLQNGLDFVTDSTNLSDDFSRNKIRHTVIPTLKQINPSLCKTMGRLARLAAEDEGYLQQTARAELERAKTEGGYSVNALAALPNPILYRAIVIAAGCTLEARHTELCAGCIRAGFGAVNINKNLTAAVKNGVFLFFTPKPVQKSAESFCLPLCVGKNPLPDGRTVVLEKFCEQYPPQNRKFNKLLFISLLCCDKICVTLTARTRKSGDVFSPAGRNCTKTVKKLFCECAVPAEQREKRVIIEASGVPVWIEGIGPCEAAKPTAQSTSIYRITILNTEDEQQ